MRKVMWAILMVLVLAVPSWALPDHTGYVTDIPGMLSAAQQAELTDKLNAYERRTGNEFAVAVVSGLEGMSIEEFSNRLFSKWGIGKKGIDNGILLVWSPVDRQLRFEVGYGMEPYLTDGRAGQIIREEIIPRFRENQWAEGVFVGVDTAIRHIDGQMNPAASLPLKAPASFPAWVWVVVFVLVVILIILIVYVCLETDDYIGGMSVSYSSSPSRSSMRSYSSSTSRSSFGGGRSGGGGASGSY